MADDPTDEEAIDTLMQNKKKLDTEEKSINVAKNKHAGQSATYKSPKTGNNYVASWANDGNTSPYWYHRSVSITGTMNNPFWVVNLGREYEIKKIVVYSRHRKEWRLKGMRVEIINKDQVVEFKQNGDGAVEKKLLFEFDEDGTTGKYPKGNNVKISIPNKRVSLDMVEVEVWNRFYE